VPMQWMDWAFIDKHKKDYQAFKNMIEMCFIFEFPCLSGL
jgi:hypothetical protein